LLLSGTNPLIAVNTALASSTTKPGKLGDEDIGEN